MRKTKSAAVESELSLETKSQRNSLSKGNDSSLWKRRTEKPQEEGSLLETVTIFKKAGGGHGFNKSGWIYNT